MDDLNTLPVETGTEVEPEGYSFEELMEMAAAITCEIKEIRSMAVEHLNVIRRNKEPEWLTSYETMQKLNICKKTLQRFRRKKLIRYSIFNRIIRYKYLDVVALLKSDEL